MVVVVRRDGPTVPEVMDAGTKRMWARVEKLMREVRVEGKEALRGYIATRLSVRAAYLLTDKVYDYGLTAYFHSRWIKRRAAGGTVPFAPLAGGRGGRLAGADILAVHAVPGGAVIRPVRAQRLIVSGAHGAARRSVRRQLEQFGLAQTFGGGLRLQFAPSRRVPGNLVALFRQGKRRGQVLASLVREVRIPQRLDVRQMMQILRGVLARKRAELGGG